MPDGKPGFVAPGSLMSLTAERLCYIKDLVGGWRIAGYIAGGTRTAFEKDRLRSNLQGRNTDLF